MLERGPRRSLEGRGHARLGDRLLLSRSRSSRPLLVDPLVSWARVRHVNWDAPELEVLAPGGYSIVYHLGQGLVAKVGLVDEEEVRRQRSMAAKGLALPVIDFAEDVWASERVRRAVCSEHGSRLVVPNTCTCDLPVNVLLMPQAAPITDISDERVAAFLDTVAEVCGRELDFHWDAKETNVGLYRGRLVALDFGDPDREDW